MSLSSWHHPPADLTLGCDEIHVWRASLDAETSRVEDLQQLLSADEQKRAERFYFDKDRVHFIVARGALRIILSHYVSRKPEDLSFCYNPNGKPALTETHDGVALRFNLSHSQGLALYAIAQHREVGIDLERVRTDFAYEKIAESFFSNRENAILKTLPANIKHQAFFTAWTRKEAYIKAVGKGLAIPLDQFEVSLIPGEPAVLSSTKWDSEEAQRWSLWEILPGSDYVATLAVEGDRCQIYYWQWTP